MNFGANHKVPEFIEKPSTQWVLYGEDNLYPQYLVNLFSRSGKHNAIITGKVNYICGQGLITDEAMSNAGSWSGDQQRPTAEGATDITNVVAANQWLHRANSDETWNELFRKIATDYELFNGFALQVMYNKLGKISEIRQLDFSRVRTNTTLSKFYYTPEWQKYSKPRDVKEFEAFTPPQRVGGAAHVSSQVLYYREYRPGMGVYPLPDYMGCIVSIETDVEIANFHLNNTKNQFWGGKMIAFNNGIPTEEAQAEIERRLKLKFSSTDNGGRFVLNFSDDAAKAPVITDLAATNLDKLFEQLRQDVTQEIFTGHKITSPALFGIQTPGALGQRQEMRDAHVLFTKNYVQPRQNILLLTINTLHEMMQPGNPVKIAINPLEQVQLELDQNALLQLMDREEARRNLLKGYNLSANPGEAVISKK